MACDNARDPEILANENGENSGSESDHSSVHAASSNPFKG